MEKIMPFGALVYRLNELKNEERFPTAYDALEAWMFHYNQITQNIHDTSLNYEDKRKRQKDFINQLLQ